jgi:D-alanyl-D-alanine carboxypeptidase
MTLGQQQRLFPPLVAKLIQFAYAAGYELTFSEAYRTPEQAALNAKTGAGIAHSLHTQRLAIDLNLFKDGVYLMTSEAYTPLGEYWKTLHHDACWGGNFSKPDGNHFSLTWQGVK